MLECHGDAVVHRLTALPTRLRKAIDEKLKRGIHKAQKFFRTSLGLTSRGAQINKAVQFKILEHLRRCLRVFRSWLSSGPERLKLDCDYYLGFSE